MEEKNTKLIYGTIIIATFLSLIILLAPYINNNIYARSSLVPNNGKGYKSTGAGVDGETNDDYANVGPGGQVMTRMQEAYRNLNKSLQVVPGMQFQLYDLDEFHREKVEGETTDESIEEFKRPEPKEIHKFHGDKGFSNGKADETFKDVVQNSITFTWKQLRKQDIAGLLCASRGVYLQATDGTRYGAYKGYIDKEKMDKIHEAIMDKIINGEINVDMNNDGLQTIYRDEKKLRPKSMHMVFKAFQDEDGKIDPEVDKAFKEIADKLGLNYTLNGDGKLIMTKEEFDRINEKYGHADENSIGDYLINQNWEFVDDEEIKDNTYSTENSYISVEEIEKRQGENWKEEGLKSFQAILQGKFQVQETKHDPVTDIKLLEDQADPEERNVKYFDTINVSPYAAYVIAVEKPQDREADEEGKAPYKYNAGITPGGMVEIYNPKTKTTGLQAAFWHVAEGIQGYKYITGGYDKDKKLMGDGDSAFFNVNSSGSLVNQVVSDSKTWKKSWLEFMKYLEEKKDQKASSKQKEFYIKYKNGKPVDTEVSQMPYDYNIKDYYGAYPDFPMKYPEMPEYNPMFVTVNDSEPGAQKDVGFKREEGVWLLGPYKLDYFQHQMEPLKSPLSSKHNVDGKGPWFADVVNANLKGRYRNFPSDGSDDNSESTLDYNPMDRVPNNNSLNREQLEETVRSLNSLTNGLNNIQNTMARNGKKTGFNSVSNNIRDMVRKLMSGDSITGNDLLEIERNIHLLEDEVKEIPEGEEKNKALQSIKEIKDAFKKFEGKIKDAELPFDKENINRLSQNIPERGNGRNKSGGISIEETLRFINEAYMNLKTGEENFYSHMLHNAESSDFVRRGIESYKGRGMSERDFYEDRRSYYLIFLEKFEEFRKAYVAILNAINAGNKISDYATNAFDKELSEVIKAVSRIDRFITEVTNNRDNHERRYLLYNFSNRSVTERRDQALKSPNIAYTTILNYDIRMLSNAISFYQQTYKGNEYDEEIHDRFEDELQEKRDNGLYGDEKQSSAKEYDEGQMYDPRGDYEPSKVQIPHEKRKDTSKKTDRFKEYGEEDEEYDFDTTIIEDNDSKELAPEHTEESLEKLEGEYSNLVGSVNIRSNSKAEALFPLSIDQISTDIKDKRGDKTDIKLYGGIYGDLGMLIKDNEAMASEGADHKTLDKLQSVSKYALSDQITGVMPTLVPGAYDRASEAADVANAFKPLADRGASLNIQGFRANEYKKNSRETALATKLWGSSKEYRDGTTVEQKRKGTGQELQGKQSKDISEAIRVTQEEIKRVQNDIKNTKTAIKNTETMIRNIENFLRRPCHPRDWRCSIAKEEAMRDLESKREELEALGKKLEALEKRLEALEKFLESLGDYQQSYSATYPNIFGFNRNNKNIKYAVNKINRTLKKNYFAFNTKLNELMKIDKYNEEVRIAKEKEEEIKKLSEFRFAVLDKQIKEMNYKVIDGKVFDLKTNNPINTNQNNNGNNNNGNNTNANASNEEGSGETKVEDVKEWKFLILDSEGNAVPEDEQEYPNPGQIFYYVIKHDPKLMEITSASFDFAYMTTNSRIAYITSNSIQLTEMQAKSEENSEDPQIEDGGLYTYNFEETFTPTLKAKMKKLHNQVLALTKSAIWINFKRIEITPAIDQEPEIPPEKGKKGELELEIPGLINDNNRNQINQQERTEEKNSGKVMGRLYIPIGGRAWIDKLQGTKHLSYNHKYDEGEASDLNGVFKVDVRRVAVKTKSDGDQITIEKVLWKQKARLFEPSTFKKIDGDNIYTSDDGKWGPYNLHDICFSEEEFKKFESQGLSRQEVAVVFEVVYSYDGLKYTSVLPLQANGFTDDTNIDAQELEKRYKNDPNAFKDSSQAYENIYIRNDFNRKFGEMEGGAPYDGDQEGNSTGNASRDHANSINASGAREGSIELEYDRKAPEPGEIYGTSTLKWYKAEEIFSGEDFKKARAMHSSTLNINLPIPIHKNIHIPAESLGKLEGKTPDGTTTGQTKDGKVVEIPWYNSGVIKYYSVEPYMKNINFGAKKRETVRLLASKDLITTSLFVNNKAINYLFNEGFDDAENTNIELSQDQIATTEQGVKVLDKVALSQEVESANNNDYTLDIYMSDYLYRTAMYSTKMAEPAEMGAMNNENDLIKTAFGNYQNYANEIYAQMKADMEGQFTNGNDSTAAGGLEDTRQLDIFLTYKVSVGNMSDMDDVVITEIRDQYNPEFMQEVKTDMFKYIQESPDELHKSYGNPEAKQVLIPGTRVCKTNLFDETQMMSGDKDEVKYTWAGDERIESPSAKKAFVNQNNEKGIKLEPLMKVDIYTVYRLRRHGQGMNGVDIPNSTVAIDTLHGTGNVIGNIVEIGSFASFDRGTETLSARVDEFSAPGTVPDLDFKNKITRTEDLYDWNQTFIEADTGYAPGLRINVFNGEDSRRLDGVVWEDSRNQSVDVKLTEQSGNLNTDKAKIYVGNGIKDPEEEPLPNQKVILEERIPIRVGSDIGQKINSKLNVKVENDEYLDVPFIWPEEVNVGDGKTVNLEQILELNSVQKTGDDGVYKFKGVPAGNFVVKVPYTSQAPGMDADNPPAITKADLVKTSHQDIRTIKWINGIDFKSTFYRNNGDNDNLNETWLKKVRGDQEKNLSYIRDDEYRRAEIMKTVRNLNHDAHTAIEALDTMNPSDYDVQMVHNHGRMVSTTPKFAFSIENLEALTDKIISENLLGEMTGAYEGVRYLKGAHRSSVNYPLYYEVRDVNAGIIQRPISKMELRKDITNISLDTNSGKRLIDLNFDLELGEAVNDERIGSNGLRDIYEPYLGALEMTSKLNNDRSEGQENVMVLNTLYGTRFSTNINENDTRNTDNISQGFIYINIDEQLLQGSNLKAEYAIRIVNLSEPDLYDKETEEVLDRINIEDPLFNQKVKAYYAGPINTPESTVLNHEKFKDSFGYGHLLKDDYYKPSSKTEITEDELEKLEINEVMDVIDNNCEYDERAFSGRPEAEMAKWKKAIKQDLVNKLAGARYQNQEVDTGAKLAEKAKHIDLRDEKGVPYIDDKRSNIYVSAKEAKPLLPLALYVGADKENIEKHCIDTWYIGTRKHISSMAEEKDLSFENTAELLTYSIKSGKRLRGIRPGSIFTQDGPNDNFADVRKELEKLNSSKMFAKTIFEKDSFTTEKISLTPPTGIKLEDKNKVMKIIVASISLIGISAVTLYARKQYVLKHKVENKS